MSPCPAISNPQETNNVKEIAVIHTRDMALGQPGRERPMGIRLDDSFLPSMRWCETVSAFVIHAMPFMILFLTSPCLAREKGEA